LNGATIDSYFEGVLRILIIVVLEVIEKHKVTQFYTPTAIRALAKENIEFVQNIH
jgi:acyl-coenzyme A synthetase/AMP-(fatty) acid ligase